MAVLDNMDVQDYVTKHKCFKFLGWFQWSWLSMCLLSSVGTAKSEAQLLCHWGSIEKVFKASPDGQGEQIVAFKYCSEITFKKGKAGSWFCKYSGNSSLQTICCTSLYFYFVCKLFYNRLQILQFCSPELFCKCLMRKIFILWIVY